MIPVIRRGGSKYHIAFLLFFLLARMIFLMVRTRKSIKKSAMGTRMGTDMIIRVCSVSISDLFLWLFL